MAKTKILTWKCPECEKVIESIYPNQLAFNKGIHLDYHKRNKLKCEKCNEEFAYKVNLDKHLKEKHSVKLVKHRENNKK